MINPLKSLIRPALLLGCAFLVPRAHAQVAPAEVSRGPSFRVSTWGAWEGPELHTPDGSGHWKAVELIDLGYSSPIGFSRGEPITFARKTMTDKGEQFLPLISVTVPREIASPLVLLLPDGKGSARPYVVDLAPAAFPWGSYQFVNFTEQSFSSQVGNERFVLSSAHAHLVNPRKDENTRMPILVRSGSGNSWTTVYSTMVINRPSKRMLVFFHPKRDSAGHAAIEARCLVDFRQDEGI